MITELQISEHTKLSGTLLGFNGPMQVWLWDLGPEQPRLPETPELPTGKAGTPEFDLANLRYKRALKVYEEELETYDRQQKEYREFKTRLGGPVEYQMFSVDARDALAADARAVAEQRQTRPRWHISARTRGYEKTPNAGLPAGMKPGHGHQANLERQIASDREFLSALKADPHFKLEARP